MAVQATSSGYLWAKYQSNPAVDRMASEFMFKNE